MYACAVAGRISKRVTLDFAGTITETVLVARCTNALTFLKTFWTRRARVAKYSP